MKEEIDLSPIQIESLLQNIPKKNPLHLLL